MAIKLVEGIVTLVADPSGIKEGLNDAEKETEKAAKKMQASMAKAFAIGAAVTAVSASIAVVVKKTVEAASAVEQYRVRLDAMYKSQKKAGEMMQFFQKIASTVPYTLDEIVRAGISLEAFGANAKRNMKGVADLAAFMGTSVEEAASAFGRAFAGGAGAADILRERGVLNIIKERVGDLTTLTLPEFRKALEDAVTDPDGRIAGATDKLANTLAGQWSMVQDAVFNVKSEIGDSLLPYLKEATSILSDNMNDLVVVVRGLRSEFDELGESFRDFRIKVGHGSDDIMTLDQVMGNLMLTTVNSIPKLATLIDNLQQFKALAEYFRSKGADLGRNKLWSSWMADIENMPDDLAGFDFLSPQDIARAAVELNKMKETLAGMAADRHSVEVDLYVREMRLDKEQIAGAMDQFTDVPQPEIELLPGDVVSPEVVAEKLQLTKEQIAAYNQWAIEGNQQVAEAGIMGVMAMGNAMADMMAAAGANNRALASMEILMSIMRIIAYISSAQAKTLAEMPFPANLAYYAQVAAMGAQLIGTVKALKAPKAPEIERPAFARGAVFDRPTVLPAGALVAEAGEREFMTPESLMRDVVREETNVNVMINAPSDGLINWDRFAVEYDREVRERGLPAPGVN